mmetsp:Transcript_10657/g.18273  ORF Transcript_10657/g.18273 Transcript_10657/m.18273 type:complete len:217 (-) Transcript_10657:314-964(-)
MALFSHVYNLAHAVSLLCSNEHSLSGIVSQSVIVPIRSASFFKHIQHIRHIVQILGLGDLVIEIAVRFEDMAQHSKNMRSHDSNGNRVLLGIPQVLSAQMKPISTSRWVGKQAGIIKQRDSRQNPCASRCIKHLDGILERIYVAIGKDRNRERLTYCSNVLQTGRRRIPPLLLARSAMHREHGTSRLFNHLGVFYGFGDFWKYADLAPYRHFEALM